MHFTQRLVWFDKVGGVSVHFCSILVDDSIAVVDMAVDSSIVDVPGDNVIDSVIVGDVAVDNSATVDIVVDDLVATGVVVIVDSGGGVGDNGSVVVDEVVNDSVVVSVVVGVVVAAIVSVVGAVVSVVVVGVVVGVVVVVVVVVVVIIIIIFYYERNLLDVNIFVDEL